MYYPLVGITDRFILLVCGVVRRDSRLANHRFPFRKLQIFISFRKLHQALLRSWLRLLLFIKQLRFPNFFPINGNCGESVWKGVDLVDK